jgi:hypothetical protein
MKLAEFKKTVALMRSMGVTRFREGDTEIEIGPAAQPIGMTEKEVEEQLKAMLGSEGMPTEDDLLMWSAGGPLPSEASADTVSVAAPSEVSVRRG